MNYFLFYLILAVCAIKMKAIEQCFHAILFMILYKVVLILKSADENLTCDTF